MLNKIVIIAALVVALFPQVARAHESVFTFKYVDADMIIMVIHNVHDAQSGVPIRYNMRLYNIDGQVEKFQKVQATISHNGKTLLDESFAITQYDDANMDYTYPHQGDYTMVLTFLDNDKQIARGEFPIVVQRGVNDGFFDTFFTVQSAVAFVIGAGAMRLFAMRSKLWFWNSRSKK